MSDEPTLTWNEYVSRANRYEAAEAEVERLTIELEKLHTKVAHLSRELEASERARYQYETALADRGLL